MAIDTPTSLYRHFASDGALLYVGISLSWPARTKAHAKGSRWFEQVAKVEIERFADRASALDAEREAIKREKPKFNVIHNRKVKSATSRPTKRKVSNDPLLRQIIGPDAIVGPALVYANDAISVMVAHGTAGTAGDLTELVLGEYLGESPEWASVFQTVMVIRNANQITMDEARQTRREVLAKLRAHLRSVEAYDTDLSFAVAYASLFPSAKSRRILEEVAAEKAAA